MPGNSLVVQWLQLHASTAGGRGSVPGQGTKIPHATWRGQMNEYYPRGNPACRGTFGGRRKAVRDRLALQGGTGDFP